MRILVIYLSVTMSRTDRITLIYYAFHFYVFICDYAVCIQFLFLSVIWHVLFAT